MEGLGATPLLHQIAEGLLMRERPAIILTNVAERLSHDDNG